MLRSGKLLGEFLLLWVVGAFVFSLTNSLIVGALLPAIRAGWRSFRTGVWILSSDVCHFRRRICAVFCFATASWQAAAAAVGAVIAFGFLTHLSGKEPNLERVASTMLQLVGSLALTTVVGLAAAIGAARAKLRVWVHPLLPELVRHDLHMAAYLPPNLYFNYAVFVLGTSLACPVVASCGLLLVESRSGLITGLVIFIAALSALAAYGWLASRIVAVHPAECWADSPTEVSSWDEGTSHG